MCVSTRYPSLGASRRLTSENAYYFMMNCLLYSRMESGFPTNDECFDEDVNVYLANVLTSMTCPSNRPPAHGGLILDDCSLFAAVGDCGSPRAAYELYRASADDILVRLGIFKNMPGRGPGSGAAMRLPERAFIGRGASYYALAQSYAAQCFRRANAVSDCLGKLSRGFERYVAVLSTMRGEYLNLCETLSDGELYHLERPVDKTRRRGGIAFQYDRFLDAYSAYLRSRSRQSRERLIAACDEIRAIDPSFTFDIGDRENVTSPE